MQASAETELDRALRYFRNEYKEVEVAYEDKSISREEYEQLLGEYWELHPYRVLWQIMWETGMRIGECVQLHLDNLDLEDGFIVYKVFKKQKPKELGDGVLAKRFKTRKVCISQDLVNRLRAFIHFNWGSFRFGFLFPAPSLQSRQLFMKSTSANNELDRLRKKLGGRWLLTDHNGSHLLCTHSFRRSWVIRYMERYKDPFECARAIGHNSPEVTYQYYTKVDLEHERSFVEGIKE